MNQMGIKIPLVDNSKYVDNMIIKSYILIIEALLFQMVVTLTQSALNNDGAVLSHPQKQMWA